MGPDLEPGFRRTRTITSSGQVKMSTGFAQSGNEVTAYAVAVVGAFGSRAGNWSVGAGGEVVQVSDDGLAGEVFDLLVKARGLGSALVGVVGQFGADARESRLK